MPRYEYVCKDCGKLFEVIISLREHEAGKIACPACGSGKVEQRVSTVHVVTGRKS